MLIELGAAAGTAGEQFIGGAGPRVAAHGLDIQIHPSADLLEMYVALDERMDLRVSQAGVGYPTTLRLIATFCVRVAGDHRCRLCRLWNQFGQAGAMRADHPVDGGGEVVQQSTGGPWARFLHCRSFSHGPQSEPGVRLSPRRALR